MYVRSPAAYEALKSFNIMRLPCRSTLQSYTGAFLHEAGSSVASISRQVEAYKSFQEQCIKEGVTKPKADGAIIFDEVKVISWNSRSHHTVGVAMTSKDQASLHDIFQLVETGNQTKQTNYVLQFLWRDLTSSFDIVGPYYMSENPMTAKFVLSCVLETVKIFQVMHLVLLYSSQ